MEKWKIIALWSVAVLLLLHLVVYVAESRHWYASPGELYGVIRVDKLTGEVKVATFYSKGLWVPMETPTPPAK